MSGSAAFGTVLNSGVAQIVTAVVVCPTGAITNAGDIHATMTSALLGGGTEIVDVAVLLADSTATVATKIANALNLNADFNADFVAVASGVNVIVTALVPAANEAGMNLAIEVVAPCAGMTDDTTSTATLAGQAYTPIVSVTNFGGLPLSVDTEDVTAHDSVGAWEEVVATIIRSGTLKLDINYDPDGATHAAATGLLYKLNNQLLTHYQLDFPDAGATRFSFVAYVTGFEPGAPVEGKLSATVSFKTDGVPTLNGTH